MSIFRGVTDRDEAEVAGVTHTFQHFLKKMEEDDLDAFITPISYGLPKVETKCCISI